MTPIISIRKAPGLALGDEDYDAGTSLAEAYADAEKAIGKFLQK